MKISLLALICVAASLATAGARADDKRARSYDTPRGELTVTYGQPEMQHAGPPPAFEALDRNHDGFVDQEEAHSGYYLLFNDFIHADVNRDKRISPHEYVVWQREPID